MELVQRWVLFLCESEFFAPTVHQWCWVTGKGLSFGYSPLDSSPHMALDHSGGLLIGESLFSAHPHRLWMLLTHRNCFWRTSVDKFFVVTFFCWIFMTKVKLRTALIYFFAFYQGYWNHVRQYLELCIALLSTVVIVIWTSHSHCLTKLLLWNLGKSLSHSDAS